MIILGIESSCDETAAAVVQDGKNILSSIVTSQVSIHRKYGGVVPELASRHHVEAILPVIQEALMQAGVELQDLGGIAVTQGPGLVGSLLVGLAAAKSLAYVEGLPLVGVNHILGHVAAIFPVLPGLQLPFISLVVSGGHTSLFRVESRTRLTLLGRTRDDAAGEAFDKVAKLLELGYPGGGIIDRLSREGNRDSIAFPRTLLEPDSLDFSFSGVKTAVLNYVKGLGRRPSPDQTRDISASFQEAVVDMLLQKTFRAARRERIRAVLAAGGVACNSRLREKFVQEGGKAGISVFFPPPDLCTDNAAMIGVAGFYLLQAGARADLTLNAYSRISGNSSPDWGAGS